MTIYTMTIDTMTIYTLVLVDEGTNATVAAGMVGRAQLAEPAG